MIYFLWFYHISGNSEAPIPWWTVDYSVIVTEKYINYFVDHYYATHLRLSGYLAGVVGALIFSAQKYDNASVSWAKPSLLNAMWVIGLFFFSLYKRILYRFEDEVLSL